MARNLSQWGNALHSGEKTYPIVQQRKRWFAISGILMLTAVVMLFVNGLNPGIDFTGGTQFQVSNVADPSTEIAAAVVAVDVPEDEAKISILGDNDVLVQIGVVDKETAQQIVDSLA